MEKQNIRGPKHQSMVRSSSAGGQFKSQVLEHKAHGLGAFY